MCNVEQGLVTVHSGLSREQGKSWYSKDGLLSTHMLSYIGMGISEMEMKRSDKGKRSRFRYMWVLPIDLEDLDDYHDSSLKGRQ